MLDAHMEIAEPRVGVERFLDAPRGVFAEHQVAAVGQREGLLVFALDRGLHRRAQRVFNAVDQIDQMQAGTRTGPDTQTGDTALRVRRGDDALLAAEPGQHGGRIDRLAGIEVFRNSAAEAGQVDE
jgi:hypothetical protein